MRRNNAEMLWMGHPLRDARRWSTPRPAAKVQFQLHTRRFAPPPPPQPGPLHPFSHNLQWLFFQLQVSFQREYDRWYDMHPTSPTCNRFRSRSPVARPTTFSIWHPDRAYSDRIQSRRRLIYATNLFRFPVTAEMRDVSVHQRWPLRPGPDFKKMRRRLWDRLLLPCCPALWPEPPPIPSELVHRSSQRQPDGQPSTGRGSGRPGPSSQRGESRPAVERACS